MAANEIPSNSQFYAILLPDTGQKGNHLLRYLRKKKAWQVT